MVFAGKTLRPADAINGPAHYRGPEGILFIPGRVAAQYIGTAIITSVSATSWQIRDRNNQLPTIPQGARIYRIAMNIPAGITATNTDLLKVGPLIGTAAGQTVVLSAGAASTTFAAQTVGTDTAIEAAALGSATSFTLFSANSTGTAAGSGATGNNIPVTVEICYTMPAPFDCAVPDYRARNVVGVAGTVVGFP